MDEYLLGVAAEWDVMTQPAVISTHDVRFDTRGADVAPGIFDTPNVAQLHSARLALEHYDAMLESRPDSYWGNYRAAAACFALSRFDRAATHLERCLERRRATRRFTVRSPAASKNWATTGRCTRPIWRSSLLRTKPSGIDRVPSSARHGARQRA